MIKSSQLILALAIALTSFNSYAEGGEDDDRRRGGGGMEASLNLAPIAFGTYSGAFHYNLSDEITTLVTLGYRNFTIEGITSDNNGNTQTTEIGWNGFMIAPEVRYHFDPSRDGNDGFFAGAFLKYRNSGTSGKPYADIDVNGDLVEYDRNSNGVSLGVTAGQVWVTDIGLTFGVWSGLGYFLFDVESTDPDYEPDPTFNISVGENLPSLDFRLGVNVGYRF